MKNDRIKESIFLKNNQIQQTKKGRGRPFDCFKHFQ